jgi:hypothetical protein
MHSTIDMRDFMDVTSLDELRSRAEGLGWICHIFIVQLRKEDDVQVKSEPDRFVAQLQSGIGNAVYMYRIEGLYSLDKIVVMSISDRKLVRWG